MATIVFVFTSANAQPRESLNVVITLPAGSATDVQARQWIKKYDETFGTASVVVNKVGGEGTVGFKYFLSLSMNNGIPILWPATGHMVAYKDDDRKDIVPLIEGSRVPFIFVVRKDLPVNTWKEWIQYNHNNPGKTTQGVANRGFIGMLHHINISNKIDPLTIFYSGNQRPEIDTAGGIIDGSWQLPGLIGTGIESRIKILGITSNVANDHNIPLLGADPKVGEWYLHQGFYVQRQLDNNIKNVLYERFKFLRELPWAKEVIAKNGVLLAHGSSKDFADNIERFRFRLEQADKNFKNTTTK